MLKGIIILSGALMTTSIFTHNWAFAISAFAIVFVYGMYESLKPQKRTA